MIDEQAPRPDPDLLLAAVREEGNDKRSRGKLKVFFGYAAGVGKTYAMLDEAQELLASGIDVVVGYIEPHTRPETTELLKGLPALPPKQIVYRNIQLLEFDLDAALARRPALILVDELAHTNARGVRNRKRYQDIEELLNAGIDVFTTVNVQHLESLNDVVQNITHIQVRETIPDRIFENADKVRLIDIEPVELLERIREGRIYKSERTTAALDHFFTPENLRLLREIALRKTASRVSHNNLSESKTLEKHASSKLLCCVGSSPASAKCIRWTARAAEAFQAPWGVIYVEDLENSLLSEEEKSFVQHNLDLARTLGAEVVTLHGDNVAETVAEYARLSGITNIVIGKSGRKSGVRRLFEKDLEDQLLLLLPNIEIHIIPGNVADNTRWITRQISYVRQTFSLSFFDFIKMIITLFLGTMLSELLYHYQFGDQNIVMVYILAVLIVSRITQGYLYGILASVLSVLTFNFFFTEPFLTFSVIDPGYMVTFLVLLVAALITSALTVRIKTQARYAAAREKKTEVLYEINKKLLITRGLDNIVRLTNEYLVRIFSRSVVFYTKDPDLGEQASTLNCETEKDAHLFLTDSEKGVVHWVYLNKKSAGSGTDTLRGALAYYTPVISQGRVLGVVGISCASGKFDQTNRSFLKRILSQVAMALERQYLSDEQKQILIDSEKEKMRSNLLRAISHDLRTPLTGILGASSVLIENASSVDAKTRTQLLSGIRDDSQWLIRMVENLLSVTRINERTMKVAKESEAAEEIVASAVSRIRNRYPQASVRVTVPEELLLVPMDGTLIEQVLINLLENAVKYSSDKPKIDVNVASDGTDAVFSVTDHGKGIPDADLPLLFDDSAGAPASHADSARGMGIGLSICQSIIRAHGGTIDAYNHSDGGAVFRFTLPL